MGSKLHIERVQSCFLRPGDKKTQKSQFYECFHVVSSVSGPKPPNISKFAGLRDGQSFLSV